jgi:hypothetical protein
MRVAVLGASGSWHSRGLIGTLATRRHEVLAIPATRLRSSVGEGKDAHVLGPATSWSSRCSARSATRSCASRIETWPIGCFVPWSSSRPSTRPAHGRPGRPPPRPGGGRRSGRRGQGRSPTALALRPRASGAAAPGSRPASCGSGDRPTVAQVDAEHERGAAGVEQAPDPSGRAGRLRAETVPGDPPARWGAAARSGVVAPASTHGSPIDASPVRMVSFTGPPASASRSATYTVGLCTPRTAPAPP